MKYTRIFGALAGAAVLFGASLLHADANDNSEIRIGNTTAYSGPLSPYSVAAKTEAAYFRMLNEKGGINGRKIRHISYDDAYSPPKTVEQTRKLVENDDVLLIFSSQGTPTSRAVRKYLNDKKVPQLFIGSGASQFADPNAFPLTMGWSPSYRVEGQIYARYILKTFEGPKVGILYQNDDYGKDYVQGMKDVLGDKFKTIVISEQPYEGTDPTVDSQILKLRSSGANILVNISSSKFAAQAIKKMAELKWQPLHFLNSAAGSIAATLKPAGLENAKGIITASYLKDPSDPQWKNDADVAAWNSFMDKYYPEGDKGHASTVYGYASAQTLGKVLAMAGNDVSRENIMKQAANLNDVEIGMLLPEIKLSTSPTDYSPIKSMRLQKFDGERWVLFGELLRADSN